ncbi:hypothetical protein A0H81_13863 [Grifola frondosa]|uniref:Uncharacterized protein n=1 Tax=Grifola frondosa TaxID=5627 RepID=A0A1C7LN82_GRIFR|nr:hypothetical protein A0H81_13863 [Grifola frondosa]
MSVSYPPAVSHDLAESPRFLQLASSMPPQIQLPGSPRAPSHLRTQNPSVQAEMKPCPLRRAPLQSSLDVTRRRARAQPIISRHRASASPLSKLEAGAASVETDDVPVPSTAYLATWRDIFAIASGDSCMRYLPLEIPSATHNARSQTRSIKGTSYCSSHKLLTLQWLTSLSQHLPPVHPGPAATNNILAPRTRQSATVELVVDRAKPKFLVEA